MTEAVTHMVIKASIIIGSWFFAQAQPLAEYGMNRAFDQAFSIGLMMLFLVYMVYENKKKDKKQDANSQAYVELLKQNTEAIKTFSESNKDVAKSVERSAEANERALNNLSRAFEKLESKL